MRRFRKHRLEYGCQLSWRTADDLENIGGGGLLLKGFGQFYGALLDLLKKTGVFNRNHCLIGESGDQVDLFLGEGTNRLARQTENSDQISFAQQRDPKHGAITADLQGGMELVVLIFLHIENMHSRTI